MGFKLLSFVFAYLGAVAFSRFPEHLEPSSLLIQILVGAYIMGCLTLSFALWTRRKWVFNVFISWCLLSISFMLSLQWERMQMSWNEFAGSLAAIGFMQVLIGLYIRRSMALHNSMKE